MSDAVPTDSIQLLVLDSVLYGAAKAFDYLGIRGQDMLDKVGDGIIDYCIKKGFIKQVDDPQQFAHGLVAFFKNNGYVGDVELTQDNEMLTFTMRGWSYLPLMSKLRNQNCFLLSCPLCLANNSFLNANSLGWKQINEEVTPDGTYVHQVRVVPPAAATRLPPEPADMSTVNAESNKGKRIGLPAFEATEYGLARAFDYLGVQAQLLLDNVGSGAVEFLQNELHVQLPKNHRKSLQELASFYTQDGLADKIELDLSDSKMEVAFTNYRYAPVLERLLDEGYRLTSCPFTLAARAVLRNAGFAATNMQWKVLNDRNVDMKMELRVAGQEFDEDKIGRMMDGA
ncbi:MAG: hypothetical protein ACLP5V_08795 [Candidatus Bathyarchaeia archaeon]